MRVGRPFSRLQHQELMAAWASVGEAEMQGSGWDQAAFLR